MDEANAETQLLRVKLHKERHRTAALLDRVAELSRDLRDRDKQLAATVRRADRAEKEANDFASRTSTTPVTDGTNEAADSPQYLSTSTPITVEVLRRRTGRAKQMFMDISTPDRASSTMVDHDGDTGSPIVVESPEPSLEVVEIEVPELPADSRLCKVLIDDEWEVMVEIPADCVAGDRHIIDPAQALRRQRRLLFLAEIATREQLLQEIDDLRSQLAAVGTPAADSEVLS